MNINIDNYEEYFLLFADNELTEREKVMVEDFVSLNPHLEEEFTVIIQSVFKPEIDLTLEDKSSLFRHTQKIINYNNYQQIFVLYIDNELNNAERSEVALFLSESPSIKSEFEQFQNCKLHPNKSIVFPHKKLLLKREDTGKVVPFKWRKAVAAAVLLGIGTWIGLDLKKNINTGLPVTAKVDIIKKPVNPLSTGATDSKKIKVVAQNDLKKPSSKPKFPVHKIPGLKIKTGEIKKYQVLKNQLKMNDLPVVNQNMNTDTKDLQGFPAKPDNNTTGQNNAVKDIQNIELHTDEIATSGNNAVPDVVSASYNAEESENNNNYAFFNITQEKFNKSKVGGFLRKVKRIIDRKISPLNSPKNQREMAVN